MTETGQMASNLVVLLLFLGGLAFAVRRFAPLLKTQPRPGNPLTHISTLALTPQCSVAVVRAGDEDLVLGLTAQNITLLAKAAPAVPSQLPCTEASVDVFHPARLRRLRKLATRPRRHISHCQLPLLSKRRV